MEKFIQIEIEKIVSKVKLAENRDDNILAFAELHFVPSKSSEPLIKVKGFTIKKKTFNEKEVITVDHPGFRVGLGFQTSFILEDKTLWKAVHDLILEDYYSQVGDAAPTGITNAVTVDPDEIPF